jgi:hypothetical protein
MEEKEKLTAGEILARIMNGDTSLTMDDFHKASNDFFKEKGLNVEIKSEKREEEKKDNILRIHLPKNK